MRNGDLSQFSVVLQEYVDRFQQDHTYTLIIRLHHNVIKTGIRIMSLSYSRISLKDIAIKLGLDDTVDAEYIVGKVCVCVLPWQCCYDDMTFHIGHKRWRD